MKIATKETHHNYFLAKFVAPYSGGEMYSWCRDNFGLPSQYRSDFRIDDARWWNGIAIGEILFRDKRDLMMFLLRWS
jgi:hypothetical protein